MNDTNEEVVRVFAGPLSLVEAYQLVLRDAGIDCQVVGTELAGSFGSALPDSIELWVRRRDLSRAMTLIAREERIMTAARDPNLTDAPHG